jgi:hypothetical protein
VRRITTAPCLAGVAIAEQHPGRVALHQRDGEPVQADLVFVIKLMAR